MAGRLTLSWVNKDQALVSDGRGGYDWVERDDPSVTEVRVLHQAGHVGDVTGTVEDNLLIQGDSYDVLHALSRTPEYAKRYRGKIKLVYIDPPFNTGQAFEHYDDALEHSVWLGMIRERLLLIRELLAPDGSVWVHLDDAEMAYCRVLMDEIFGRSKFIATVVWQRRDGRPNDAIIGQMHDYILVYASDPDRFAEVRNRLDRTDEQEAAYRNPDSDPRGLWRNDNYTSNKSREERPNSWFPVIRPVDGVEIWPKPHAVWRYSPERHAQNVAEDRIWWGPKGLNTMPKLKRFRSEVEGIVPMTWWPFTECGSTRNAKDELKRLLPGIKPFATPKPERLLQRIVEIASNPGEIVLDCFAGSGTTAAVAHKMGRKWVTVEVSSETVETFIRPRLEKVVVGEDGGGITEAVGWPGGDGFRMLAVGPSLYERAGSRLLLAEWAKGEEFAQAVAAQLGFVYEPYGAFVGTKGRTRLAVVDGVADDVVVSSIVSHLDDGERVTIVAKAAAPGAEQALRELSSGSRLLKAPRDLVRRGKIVR